MLSAGIRELKNNLSRYIRRLRPGQVIAVTDHGRVVAELRSPAGMTGPITASSARGATRYAQLITSGVIRPAVETGDPLADWPSARAVSLSRGSAAELIGEDRGR